MSATLYEQTMCVCQLVINRLAEITSADLTAHTPNSFPLQMSRCTGASARRMPLNGGPNFCLLRLSVPSHHPDYSGWE